jgi:hypothetical protein
MFGLVEMMNWLVFSNFLDLDVLWLNCLKLFIHKPTILYQHNAHFI